MSKTTKAPETAAGRKRTTSRKPVRKSARERAAPWEEVRERILSNPEVQLAYEELLIREKIGRHLQEARKRCGLTQAQVAEAAQTTQPVIARIEAGRGSVPTFRLLDRIARAVGLRATLTLKPAA